MKTPFGFQASVALKAGQSAVFPLGDFTKENGERFDPAKQKLVKVWIGGGNYDFEAYGF